ncbi:hypothetical protein [Flavobacterium aquidurense]|uniref:hypothetical protein n=1 Tax=Flavobacterium aquidurense TaxID=362413 RepID=UPI0028596355|nr:hypothetical protein [Flavobacterium aquidurense]MDR7370780.1 hypothetical protein [Flavobacterium aquidurense]
MKKKILLILIIVILNSCGKCIETNLTAGEKEWFSVYEKGQNIIFKSNLNHLDTIVVTEKLRQHNNSDCNYYGIGPMQPEIMFITLTSKICHNEPYCTGEIFISKDEVDKIFVPGFSLFGLYSTSENSLPKETWVMLTTTKKNIHTYIFLKMV